MKKQEVIDLASRRGLCVYEQYKGRKVYYKVRIPVFEDEKEIPTSYRDELVRNIKEVFDVQTVVEQVSTPEKVALFALAKDDDLLRLGVPEVQLDLVRSFVNKEDFYKSESAMPHDVYEHLSWLAEGFPMEEVLELVSEEQNSSAFSEDLAAALDVPTTLK